MTETSNPLKPAWDAILEVYKPFAEICARHDLRMWVGYGTAIGTVRHKGFIPWDDDFDVVMPRPDYERFIDEFAKELPAHLKLVTQANTPEFTLPFAKIMDSRRDVVEAVEKTLGRVMPQGVYIDIFPLDGFDAKKSRLASRFWTLVLKFRRAWLCRKLYPKHPHNKYLFSLGFLSGVFTPLVHTKAQFDRYYHRLATQVPFDGSEYCAYYEATYNAPRAFLTRCFEGTVKMPFDDLEVPMPSGYHELLTREYGDYMTPPPPEKRVSNHQDSLVAQWKYGPTMEVL